MLRHWLMLLCNILCTRVDMRAQSILCTHSFYTIRQTYRQTSVRLTLLQHFGVAGRVKVSLWLARTHVHVGTRTRTRTCLPVLCKSSNRKMKLKGTHPTIKMSKLIYISSTGGHRGLNCGRWDPCFTVAVPFVTHRPLGVCVHVYTYEKGLAVNNACM